MSNTIHRRQLLAAAATTGAAVLGKANSGGASDAPEQKIVVGTMGLGGRGTSLSCQFAQQPGVEVAYVCDVDKRRVAGAVRAVGRVAAKGPRGVGDYRRILDDPAVDVLVIATADHWHAPAAIAACAAGKHVYVEKPCCHNPREGELLLAASRKYNRLVQHGTQRRSWPSHREAIAKLHDGVIGRVLFSRACHVGIRSSIGLGNPAPAPQWLDWDLWQGPAPRRPYRDNVVHYNWHFFWHWGCGEIGNNGVHKIDVCRWGLQVDFPRQVSSTGGKLYFDDDRETPDTHVVSYDFGDRVLVFENRNWHRRGFEGETNADIAFYGTGGSMIVRSAAYTIYDMQNREIDRGGGRGGEVDHVPNFLDGIRHGSPLNADIETGYRSTLLCHLGAIAHRTGHTLHCDPATGHPLDCPEAESLWQREYEPGWEPKV
jgi:predicted dehydrogenase